MKPTCWRDKLSKTALRNMHPAHVLAADASMYGQTPIKPARCIVLGPALELPHDPFPLLRPARNERALAEFALLAYSVATELH